MSDDIDAGDEGENPSLVDRARAVSSRLRGPRIAGVEETKKSLDAMTKSVKDLEEALERVNRRQQTLTAGITDMLGKIEKQATTTTSAFQNMINTVGAMGGGGGGGGGGGMPTGGTASPAAAVQAAQANSSKRLGMTNIANLLGSDIFRSMAMFPIRFMRDQMGANRELALATSMTMGGQAFATGTTTQQIMANMAGLPGSVMGSPEEQLALFDIARRAGAMTNIGALSRFGTGPTGPAANAPRAAGFLQGVQQMQYMTPGAQVGQMATTLGGFSANVQAQQMAQYVTGGAYTMIGRGGRQKSVQEWAESILRWLEGLRPGDKHDKPFTFGELMSQYFPGSNIDAWFNVNMVPQDMREYWWTYALGKASKTGTTAEKNMFPMRAMESDLAYQRLRSGTAQTQSGFQLAGQLAGTYANREQANRWFNEMLGQVMNEVIPNAIASGPLRFVQALPESVEELLMRLLEGTGTGGAIIGGMLGYGGLGGAESILQNLLGAGLGGVSGLSGLLTKMVGFDQSNLNNLTTAAQSALDQVTGDVGDVGDFGPLGGTSTAGLHPDMRKRVRRMMKANPALSVTSGFRDRATQMRLKAKGYTKVSGGPSAHTRGMAADLGPPDQYPWIVANAARFGLKSGAHAGEPWHVGMGDVGDAEQDIGLMSLFRQLIGMEGAGGQDATNLIGQMVPGILNLLLGVMGKWGKPGGLAPGSPEAGRLAFQGGAGGIYSRLVKAADYRLGGLIPSANTGTTTTPTGPGGPTGPIEGNLMQRAIQTAHYAHAAGFTGTDLWKMVAIAGRESSWDPSALNPNGHDTGLFQINWPGSAGGRSQQSLYDPTINAQAAYELYTGSGRNVNQPWGVGPDGTWVGISGDAMGYTNRPWGKEPLSGSDYGISQAKEAVRQAGYPVVGDVEQAFGYRPPPPTMGARGNTMVFNNSFVIQGGGGSGLDARRVATQIADHLDAEMKQRMSRMN